MPQFHIEGGVPLQGEVAIQGAKNAALPLLAATVLTGERCTLRNVPPIADIKVLLEILVGMGAEASWSDGTTLTISNANLDPLRLDPNLVRKLRASILLIGPLLARFGKVSLPYPGGCLLGKRPIDTHLLAMQAIGAEIQENGDGFHFFGKNLSAARVFLREASVTATENILTAMAGTGAVFSLRNAASEPHVGNLIDALRQMGAAIDGSGHQLEVTGKQALQGFDIAVIPDQLEIGSLAVLSLVTKGSLTLHPVIPEHLDPILLKLTEAGATYTLSNNRLTIDPPGDLRGFDLTTNIWPGFPTDLQSPFSVLATQCTGKSMIHDWMYEGRLFYIDKLIKMGADIILCDPHRIIVSGPTQLKGKEIESPDIRAGMALLIAALGAEGPSVIEHIGLIDRGHLEIETRLQAVGARIVRMEMPTAAV